jgi:hypothetical protein
MFRVAPSVPARTIHDSGSDQGTNSGQVTTSAYSEFPRRVQRGDPQLAISNNPTADEEPAGDWVAVGATVPDTLVS